MSAGPGTAQRRIVKALDQQGVAYLVCLATGMSDYKSLYRAACRLHDAGKLGILICRYGLRKVIVYRLDFQIGDVAELRRRLEREDRP
jgi:hypothetical protein